MASELTSPNPDAEPSGRTAKAPLSPTTVGLLFGLMAYGLWGTFPLFFALLSSVPPIEVVAHRVIWSLVFLAVLLTATRGWGALREALRDRRAVGLLAVAAVFLSMNWVTYVYSVWSNQVVEASLGYFINPLVSVALGVLALKERLRPLQWTAVGIALIAVVELTVAYGAIPWIALILAFSFGTYGLLKKLVGFGAIPSLTIETAVLSPIAVVLLLTLEGTGAAIFVQGGLGISILLILLGPVTAIPLLAFGAAATRIPLSMLGLIQYITPISIFIFGITVFHDEMQPGRWIGFILVWIALVVFTIDALRNSRSNFAPVAEAIEAV